LLPLPASFFKVLPLPQKFNRFHIPAPCFMKNAFTSGSSKRQMLPKSLPASFFKVLPLPQKFPHSACFTAKIIRGKVCLLQIECKIIVFENAK